MDVENIDALFLDYANFLFFTLRERQTDRDCSFLFFTFYQSSRTFYEIDYDFVSRGIHVSLAGEILCCMENHTRRALSL